MERCESREARGSKPCAIKLIGRVAQLAERTLDSFFFCPDGGPAREVCRLATFLGWWRGFLGSFTWGAGSVHGAEDLALWGRAGLAWVLRLWTCLGPAPVDGATTASQSGGLGTRKHHARNDVGVRALAWWPFRAVVSLSHTLWARFVGWAARVLFRVASPARPRAVFGACERSPRCAVWRVVVVASGGTVEAGVAWCAGLETGSRRAAVDPAIHHTAAAPRLHRWRLAR